MNFAPITNKQAFTRRGIVLAIVGVAVVMAVTGYINANAGATPARPEHKITLCHGTSSYKNPYVVITVDVASVLKKGHDHHDGPVFTPNIPKHEAWGDIIPPFDFGGEWTYAGKNWVEGQALYGDLCGGAPTTTTQPNTTTTLEPEPGLTTTTEPSTTITSVPGT